MKVDIDGLRRLLANPCCGACVIKAMEKALPKLVAEAEAGRELRKWMGRITMGVDGAKHLEDYDKAVGVD
jgi:hypothetical protein